MVGLRTTVRSADFSPFLVLDWKSLTTLVEKKEMKKENYVCSELCGKNKSSNKVFFSSQLCSFLILRSFKAFGCAKKVDDEKVTAH